MAIIDQNTGQIVQQTNAQQDASKIAADVAKKQNISGQTSTASKSSTGINSLLNSLNTGNTLNVSRNLTQQPSSTPIPTVINTSVPAPTAATVYSAPNITSAITAPTQAPNLSDPYGLYDQYMNSPEIQAAQQAVAQGQQQINAVNQGLRTTTTALQNQNEQALGGTGASVNLIGRQVGRARELTANELAALGETQAANVANLATLRETAGQRYQIAQQERSQIQDLIRSTGGNAGISFADSYETALAKASKYEKEQENEAKKEKEKDSLKESLRSAGLKTSGSMKELEKRWRKYLNSLKEEQKKEKEQARQDKLNSTNKSSNKNSLTEEGTQGINSFFSGVKGEDGYVSPQDWAEAKSQWGQNGLSTASFNAIFGKWKNPNDKYL